jgi:hypothetical protein
MPFVPKKRPDPTFKDLLSEPTWSETEASRQGQHAIRPGKFNQAGEFHSPDGKRLELTDDELTPGEAQRHISEHALLAYEGCGCGGVAECAPVWATAKELAQLKSGPKPRLVKGHGAPTWVDLWTDGTRKVVFAHGDVDWGSLTERWADES